MTLAELAAARTAVKAARARGETPRARDLLAAIAGPATLAVALEAERRGSADGHVEFRNGAPTWVAGPPRFRR